MRYKYGECGQNQISDLKSYLRKRIFFLLLYVEKMEQFNNVNIDSAFNGLMSYLDGINSLLLYPKEIILIMSSLESAYVELKKENFSFQDYRKYILDAGAEVLNIKEV